jgi:hypothetical protein
MMHQRNSEELLEFNQPSAAHGGYHHNERLMCEHGDSA